MPSYDSEIFYDGATDYDAGLAAALSTAIASGIPGKRSRTYAEFIERYGKREKHDWHKMEKERQEKLHSLLQELLGPKVALESQVLAPADVGALIDKMETPPNFALELLILSQYI